jgi:hypothetical protein
VCELVAAGAVAGSVNVFLAGAQILVNLDATPTVLNLGFK